MATEAALSLLSEVMTCGGGGMRHRGRMCSSDESLRMAGHATCEARAQCFTCPSIVTRPSPECGMQRSGNKDARRRHSDWSLPKHEEEREANHLLLRCGVPMQHGGWRNDAAAQQRSARGCEPAAHRDC